MEHTLFESVEAMLAPEALSALAGQPITDVKCSPLVPLSFSASGSELFAVETNGGLGPRYVLKRSSLKRDWLMRALDDRLCRSVTIWQHGLMDKLPSEIAQPILACAIDGPNPDNRALLMRDVSEALYAGDQPISIVENERFLDAMAALHAAYWEHSDLAEPALGLCSLWQLHICFTPQTTRLDLNGSDDLNTLHEVQRYVLDGWPLLDAMIPPELGRLICDLLKNPQPLCDALSRYPQTFVHADLRQANLGLMPCGGREVVFLDWQYACYAPPAVDLAWYLGAEILPISQDAAVVYYRQRLSERLRTRFNEQWWQPQLELSLLGGFLRQGWIKMLRASGYWDDGEAALAIRKAQLAWWLEQVRAAARWL
jgi:hypothetical protein